MCIFPPSFHEFCGSWILRFGHVDLIKSTISLLICGCSLQALESFGVGTYCVRRWRERGSERAREREREERMESALVLRWLCSWRFDGRAATDCRLFFSRVRARFCKDLWVRLEAICRHLFIFFLILGGYFSWSQEIYCVLHLQHQIMCSVFMCLSGYHRCFSSSSRTRMILDERHLIPGNAWI